MTFPLDLTSSCTIRPYNLRSGIWNVEWCEWRFLLQPPLFRIRIFACGFCLQISIWIFSLLYHYSHPVAGWLAAKFSSQQIASSQQNFSNTRYTITLAVGSLYFRYYTFINFSPQLLWTEILYHVCHVITNWIAPCPYFVAWIKLKS